MFSKGWAGLSVRLGLVKVWETAGLPSVRALSSVCSLFSCAGRFLVAEQGMDTASVQALHFSWDGDSCKKWYQNLSRHEGVWQWTWYLMEQRKERWKLLEGSREDFPCSHPGLLLLWILGKFQVSLGQLWSHFRLPVCCTQFKSLKSICILSETSVLLLFRDVSS